MSIATWFKTTPASASTYKWKAVRPCACGGENFGSGRFDDVVHCEKCGLIYYTRVTDPIVKLVKAEKQP